ncbi:MAG TPA: heavy-metal-associated domain-containing protein [Methylophilus sp.]
MITFQVNDMTCGHCASNITKAIKALDPTARVEIDLHQHRVSVAVVSADAQSVSNAIAEAGYTPAVHEAQPADMSSDDKAASCCGGCH